MTIDQIKQLRESEDKIEFKEARKNFPYDGGKKSEQKERRKCYLGYIVALCNEGGGSLVFGMKDKSPHDVVGTNFAQNKIGQLEDDVYSKLQLRVHISELFDSNGKRVLVTKIPSRPKGRALKFEGVPLMRTGDSLRNMSDEEYHSILSEQEEDFSAKICPNLKLEDLDDQALLALKERYSEKQQNDAFLAQSNLQVLKDLDLIKKGQLTYAALILLGKREKINEILPQCAIHLEYRSNPDDIQYDKRDRLQDPFFLLIEKLWLIIDARNKEKKLQIDSYIIDLPALNREVIRESVNNAVAHRDYSKTSEIVIKQSPTSFEITSHGGFPLGVDKETILTVNSTPRNRLLSEVLTKTGFVERSGQGVDKIYYQTLSEGKDFPTYANSDYYQVKLYIPLTVKYPVFSIFIKRIQSELSKEGRLGVHHLICLVKIREGKELNSYDRSLLERLEEVNAIKQSGKEISLSKEYTVLVEKHEGSDEEKIIDFVRKNDSVKMGEILSLFNHRLNRRQVNNMVFKLVDEGKLRSTGKGAGTKYLLKE